MRNSIYLFLFIILVSSCQSKADNWLEGDWIAKEIPLDNTQSLAPNLFVAEDGEVYLSYLHHPNDSLASLRVTRLQQQGWTDPRTVASGTDWFVNWADFPSVAAFRQKPDQLAAHWLEKRAAGTYDYDIKVSIANEQGNWSLPFTPHRDSVAAEHGFVSLLPLPNGRIFASWLDGRFTKGSSTRVEPQHAHGEGAMTLRVAEFDTAGQLFAEAEVDHRVCDCCQTDAALGPEGPILVYRDRSEAEIRDVFLVRRIEGVWQLPRKIGEDNWQINGCPVNGPAIATYNNTVAVAWFTMAQDSPKVQVVFSADGGQTFGTPIRLDQQEAIGRVDVVLADEQNALVSFMENDGEQAWLKVVPVTAEGRTGASAVEYPTDFSRRSGFPVLERIHNHYILAFTVVDGKNTRVKTMRITREN